MISKVLKVLIVVIAAALPGAAFAHGYKVGEIEISDPYARAMLPGAKVGGGYLIVTNKGAADRLVSVASDRAPSVQLHEMKMDGGIMVMRQLGEGVAIPANSAVEFKPGGYHVMFLNVTKPFKEGELVKATLTFEKAGSVEVEFQVGSAAGGAPQMDHDAMEQGK